MEGLKMVKKWLIKSRIYGLSRKRHKVVDAKNRACGVSPAVCG